MEKHLANHGDTTQLQPVIRPQRFNLFCSSCSLCRDVAQISLIKGAIWGSIFCKQCQSSRKSLKWLCECRIPWHTCSIHRKSGMACQGRVQPNTYQKRFRPRPCLGPLGGGIIESSSQAVSQPGRQEISPDRDNPGTGKNLKIGDVLLTVSSSSHHEVHDIQHVGTPTSVVFRKYLDSGLIQPGTPMPTLQSRAPTLPFSLISGGAGLTRHIPPTKRRASLYAKVHKRTRRDSDQTNTGSYRNVNQQDEVAGSTVPPAVNVAVDTARPPDTTIFHVAKRAAPMNIQGSFCRRCKIPKLT